MHVSRIRLKIAIPLLNPICSNSRRVAQQPEEDTNVHQTPGHRSTQKPLLSSREAPRRVGDG